MKICRFTLNHDSAATPRVGIVEDDGIRDVTRITDALPPLRWPVPPGDQLIANLPDLAPRMAELAGREPAIALDAVSLLAPVANPTKFVAGAGNWKHMGAPFGMIGFMGKAVTALAGPSAGLQIRWPDRTTVHEPELAIIIGRKIDRPVGIDEALSHVAGYACAFDSTLKPEREDWAFCKSFDTYGTIGPWLVTADEIPNPSELGYRFWIDGDLRGERSFADLTGSPAEMIAFASTQMTLYPGDIFMSGAADVGPVLPGETMTIEIPRIGSMSVKAAISEHARTRPWGG
ncbi:MAG: fumarylacetoacetate hydrolase family protein [Novosphingobium sp.]|jgi:2-keto-4-pentenoate hydratase/2-oxohepta-3-ene-1,7-dioic acid hydratase in catechol pathway|nr:fumarylacetoacetate hydrolase family protein [Novosphingobium sp.]